MSTQRRRQRQQQQQQETQPQSDTWLSTQWGPQPQWGTMSQQQGTQKQQQKQMQNEVKTLIQAVNDGDDAQVQESTQTMLKLAGDMNAQEPGLGNKTLVKVAGLYLNVSEFMDSLTETELRAIREAIDEQVPEEQVMAGGSVDNYTALEIILGIVFFPWSLIYFLLLRR